MGTKGDQKFDFQQNKTLSESAKNGVSIHLFEVFEDKKYTYAGIVELAEKPYQEKQLDQDNLLRNVCIFPLRLLNGQSPIVSQKSLSQLHEKKIKQVTKLNDQEITNKAKNAAKNAGARNVISKQYARNPYVTEHAKRIANGICQLCENPAPFKNHAGEPYLETHHIDWLANGGEDSINNTVALCPNCHRKMHIQNKHEDIEKLKIKATSQKL